MNECFWNMFLSLRPFFFVYVVLYTIGALSLGITEKKTYFLFLFSFVAHVFKAIHSLYCTARRKEIRHCPRI